MAEVVVDIALADEAASKVVGLLRVLSVFRMRLGNLVCTCMSSPRRTATTTTTVGSATGKSDGDFFARPFASAAFIVEIVSGRFCEMFEK